jgi:hypothetical protein
VAISRWVTVYVRISFWSNDFWLSYGPWTCILISSPLQGDTYNILGPLIFAAGRGQCIAMCNTLRILVFIYYRKHPNTSLLLFVIDFTILDRFHTFRNISFEKMWYCHLFSKYGIFKRSLKSLNYYYLIFLSRVSMSFILYAFCHIFIHTYEIKRNFCEKEIFYRVTSLGV